MFKIVIPSESKVIEIEDSIYYLYYRGLKDKQIINMISLDDSKVKVVDTILSYKPLDYCLQ
jgi:hypothetical protein